MTYTHSITAYANSALIWDREKKDIEYSRCIGLYIVFNEINALVQQCFDMHDIPYGLVKAGIMGLLFLLFIWSILHFNRKEYIALFTVLGIVTFLYVYSAIAGASVSYMASWAVNSFGVGVPLATFAYLIEDKSKLYSFLYKCTWPVLPMTILDFALFHETDLEYSLHFGYMMLFVIVFHFSYMLKEKKLFFIPLIIGEFVLILLYGSRTAIICFAAYVLIRFVMMEGRKDIKMIALLAVLLLIPVTFLAIKYILPGLVDILVEKGLRVRTLELMRDFRMIDFWDRTYGWVEVLELMKQRPIFGWGIREGAKYREFIYPHQFFLECWESFGFILGTMIIIPTLYFIAKAFRRDNSIEADLCRIYISMEFVKLMVSHTFITSYQFYIMMGLLVAYSIKKAQNSHYSRTRQIRHTC